jgi:spore maturation protein CgeB
MGSYSIGWAKKANRLIVKQHHSFEPHLVLVIKGVSGFWLERTTIEEMSPSVRAIWFIDRVKRNQNYEENIFIYDKCFVFDASDTSSIADIVPVHPHFLPLGFDREIYRPMPNIRKDIDVCFVGWPYPNRIQIIERLLDDFPDRSFRIYSRYARYSKPKSWLRLLSNKIDARRRSAYRNRFIHPSQVNLLYARSKIALNIHHKQSSEGCNPRVFEIMGSGTFQVADANPYMRKNFSDCIGLYEDYAELESLIRRYINDDAARNEMAAKSLEVSTSHTLDRRIEDLCAACGI